MWRLRLIAKGFDVASDSEQWAGLAARLRDVADHEAARDPASRAKEVLWNRCPDIRRFELEERQLDFSYDLSVVADKPPRSLANLAAVTALDLQALRDAVAAQDRGAIVDLLDSANAMLKRRVNDSWGQSDLEARLVNDGKTCYPF